MDTSRRDFLMQCGVLGSSATAAALLAGCGANNTPPTVAVPGEPKSGKSKMLETGADLLQAMPPIKQINMYLNGFHFYADDMGRQVEAHHYCTMLNQDIHQCVIFDSNGPNARLIGVEHIISERLFVALPDEERRFWHSHHYEVKSGELIMPAIPTGVEKEAMEMLVTTYGKTWHFWQVDRGDQLPLGVPQLMMGFTKDGQANPQFLADRDRRFGASTEDKRKSRESIPMPTVAAGANAWEQTGQTPTLDVKMVAVKNRR